MSDQKPDLAERDRQFTSTKKFAVLGRTLEIEGEISGQEDVKIEGLLNGKISLEHNEVLIEKNAVLKADISARDVTIRGQVEGNVFATGKVHIGESGRMSGDIVASRISIGEGAQFKGRVQIKNGPSPSR